MFDVEIAGPQIKVSSRRHRYVFSVDESHPNPLETVFAAIAGCAGVYALKTAKKIGRDPAEIRIVGKAVNRPANPFVPMKWITEVRLPPEWTPEDREALRESIQKCAVKELLSNGGEIEFNVEIATDSSKPDVAGP